MLPTHSRDIAILSDLQVYFKALQRKNTEHSVAVESAAIFSERDAEADFFCCQGLVFLRKTSGQTAQNTSGSGASYWLQGKARKSHVLYATACETLKPNRPLLSANTMWCLLDLTTRLPCHGWWCPHLAEVVRTCA